MPVARFIPNLGPRQRRTRAFIGLGGLVVSTFVIAGLLASGAGPIARLFVFPPLWVSLIALYEAPKGTGVILALTGRQGVEQVPVDGHTLDDAINEAELRRRWRRQAVHVVMQAGVVAALATAVVVVVPTG